MFKDSVVASVTDEKQKQKGGEKEP